MDENIHMILNKLQTLYKDWCQILFICLIAIVEIYWGGKAVLTGKLNIQDIHTECKNLSEVNKAARDTPIGSIYLSDVKKFFSLQSTYDAFLSAGYVVIWGGVVTLSIGIIALILLVFKRTIDNCAAWLKCLTIYPILLEILSYLLSKHTETFTLFIPLFSVIVTGSATVKLWDQLWEQVFVKSDEKNNGWGVNIRINQFVAKLLFR